MDKPIIFNTSMVQALLAGHKTQTHRIVKAKSHVDGVTNKQSVIVAKKFQHAAKAGRWYGYDQYDITCYADSPYGEPGDLLWVRETWALPPDYNTSIHGDLKTKPRIGPVCLKVGYPSWDPWSGTKWRPSIHMPRWASRLSLLVKDIRIERVQDITKAEAEKEGWHYMHQDGSLNHNPKRWFKDLWNSINKQRGYGWDINPWVWVIEFKVFQQNIDQVSKDLKSFNKIKNLELVP